MGPLITKVVSALTGNATKNLSDGVANIITKFKADPTKVAEMDNDLQKLLSNNEVAMATISSQAGEVAEQEATKQLEIVNATMQTEAKSEHWIVYSWRPMIGYAVAIQCLALGLGFASMVFRVALGYTIAKDAVSSLADMLQAMAPLFGIEGAILGITAWFRGKKQVQEAANNAN